MCPPPVTFGLISDTHMPDRWRTLPPAVFDVFRDVDVILHAGDVGELSVLDELSAAAPVIGVHGNDDTPDALRELPYQQVVTAAGRRILLTHSHYPDRAKEMAERRFDAWQPKLARLAELARRAGASMLVYGHTHIPFVHRLGDVWLVNPGAIAAGNHFARQMLQTVARLTLAPRSAPDIAYFDAITAQPVSVSIDLEAGFKVALSRVNASIATPEVEQHRDWVFREIYPLAPEPIRNAVRRVMFRCLEGEIPRMTLPDVLSEIYRAPDVPAAVKDKLRARWPES